MSLKAEPPRLSAPTSLPHSEELERAYLVIPMLSPDLFEIAASLIPDPDVFYDERHRAIWLAQKACMSRGEPLDERALQNELETSGKFELVGGIAYLAGLTLDLPAGGLKNVEKYAGMLRGLWAKRRLIMMASQLVNASMNGSDAQELIADTSAALTDISMGQTGAEGPRLLRESLVDFDRWEPTGGLLGVPTGLYDLDRMLLGLQSGQQIVVGARPGMGKTALALNFALSAAKAGIPSLFFSLEMPETQCRDRLMAIESGVPLRSILTGQISTGQKADLRSAMQRLGNLPIWIDDRPSLSADQISATAAVHQMREGLGLMIVDYLGLVRYSGSKQSEVDQLGDMARDLRDGCRRLSIPNLLLHQLNRGVEGRTDKRATMADLRGSGKIEEHADVIVFIYRDEVYNEDPDTKGLAELIVAKHRQGEIGKVDAVFIGETVTFTSLDRRPDDERSNAW